MSFFAESEGFSADMLIEKLLEETPTKEDELFRDPRFQSLFVA
jgi:MoxR-like ATPase